jgi:hypothetical protein
MKESKKYFVEGTNLAVQTPSPERNARNIHIHFLVRGFSFFLGS